MTSALLQVDVDDDVIAADVGRCGKNGGTKTWSSGAGQQAGAWGCLTAVWAIVRVTNVA